MKNISKLLVLLFLFIVFFAPAKSQMVSPGEDLLYEVSFLGVKLGSIRVVTEESQMHNGIKVCKAKSYIDSYKGIPFVDLHSIYESWFDQSVAFSHKFESHTKEDDYWLFDQLLFDHEKGEIKVEKWKKKEKYLGKVIKTSQKAVDGLNLFFFARQYTKASKYVKIPTMIDKDFSYTYINFQNKKESVSIDAINYPVKTVYFNGKTDWTGIYGLNGNFEGWFSDDAASIPIKAKLNVYVGSVKIELIKYKRNGWVPPKG